jgi:hypothetical protein
MKRLVLLVGTLLLAVGLAAPALSVNASGRVVARAPGILGAAGRTPSIAAVSPSRRAAAAERFRRQGYLVPNQAAYDRGKAATADPAGQPRRASVAPRSSKPGSGAPLAAGDPDIDPAWEGIADANHAPPDTTGAIGPSRYIELINTRFAIYDRSGSPLSTGGLRSFIGANTNFVTDPQVLWDPGTNRFYFVALEFSHFVGAPGANPDNRLYMGFSRTASPSNASTTNWCKYIFSYGDFLPDYPKLGDSSAFFMTGVNAFDPGGSYAGSDVVWISKPPKGTGCPAPSKFHANAKINLKLHDGSPAFTPIPVNQTDPSPASYIITTPAAGGSFLDTIRVTRNTKGNAAFDLPIGHNVLPYSPPPSAPQSGTAQVLDTLDGRLTNAVSAFDPSLGKVAIWTQHTVAGGAGSQVAWYEIADAGNSGPPARAQAVTDASLYVFNGAISPDRKVSGSTKRFGDAFVVGFNTSSATDFVRIQMTSQWADHTMSPFVEVQASPGFNDDFSCYDPPGFTCRWGDYSGATPDPGSNAYSNHGRVWLSNQWNVASLDSSGIDWRTYNWGTNVAPFVILSAPTPLFQKVTSFPVSWELGNEATQANINLRQAAWNGSLGPYSPWKTGVPAGSDTYVGSTGNTYCFQAEALDSVPNSWGFTADRCAVVPLDDRALGASSGWSRRTGSGFFLNTFTRTTQLGKSLRRTGIHAKSAQILVEKCPTCGSIKIYWNGVLKHTYNLHAGSVQKKVYLSAVSFSSVKVGTLKIVVSSSGKPVIIDGLGISAV